MNVRMVGEVIAKGMNTQDDSCFPFQNSCRGGQAFGERIGDDAAKYGKALGVATENIPQNARDSEDPVSVRNRETDIGGDGLSCVHRTALMAGRADTALLAGEGKQVFVIAMVTTHAQESLSEVTAAEKAIKCFFKLWPQLSKSGAILLRIGSEEIVERGFNALPERRGLGLARAV